MGGLGRSGTVASLLLIELGESNSTVIHRVRERRKGAVENELQENFIKEYNSSKWWSLNINKTIHILGYFG